MSEGLTFHSWAASGLSVAQTQVADEHGRPTEGVSTVSAGLTVDAFEAEIGREIRLRGPGDVLRLDKAVISRMEPPADTREHSPNVFPAVELSDPALPWAYTPARPGPSGRLTPWLVLIVVPLDENVALSPLSDPPGMKLSIGEAAGSLLPDLSEAYGWGHVQSLPGGEAFARLICPVRLAPRAAYLACLVPAFEAGRLAGLGREVADSADPAWTTETQALDLPVYHHWSFTTGNVDFETLVRRLRPFPVDETVGLHDLDLSDPGAGLGIVDLIPEADPGAELPLSFEGALMSPVVAPRKWPSAHRSRFTPALKDFLSTPPEAAQGGAGYRALEDDPVVGAPLYGRWQTESLNGDGPAWMEEVNLDPRWRAVAGLGARAVRSHQEEDVTRAWAALKGARDVNDHLRKARVAYAGGGRVHARTEDLRAASLLPLSEPMLDVVAVSATATVASVIGAAGGVTGSALSPGFRRFNVTAARMNPGTLTAKPATAQHEATVTSCLNGAAATFSDRLPSVDQGVSPLVELTANGREISALATPVDMLKIHGAFRPGALRRQEEDALQLRTRPVRARSQTVVAGANLAALRQKVLTEMSPDRALVPRVLDRVEGLSRKVTRPGKMAIPKGVALSFRIDVPSYLRLQRHDPEFLLPGFGAIPPDTISLVETNPRFIESFLLGMNHEFARELAWRQVPTWLNATWYRRFWEYGGGGADDIPAIRKWDRDGELGGNLLSNGQARAVTMIKGALFRRFPETRVYAAPAQWEPSGMSDRSQPLSLLKGEIDPKGRVPQLDDPKALLWPIFSGKIGREASFFAFETSVEKLVGKGDDPGWFIVFEQPEFAPRFGLDDPRSADFGATPERADALSWGHFAGDDTALAGLTHAHLHPDWAQTDVDNAQWGRTAAETARLCYQSPVRILFHASALLEGLA